jgi:hypothetical protein
LGSPRSGRNPAISIRKTDMQPLPSFSPEAQTLSKGIYEHLKNSSVDGGDSPLRIWAASSLPQSTDISAYSALKGRDCASSCPFKGNRHEVVYVARRSGTLEELVVYRALYGDSGIWVRPLKLFLGKVTVPGKGEVPRFRLIPES